jgi:hypothetical protein
MNERALKAQLVVDQVPHPTERGNSFPSQALYGTKLSYLMPLAMLAIDWVFAVSAIATTCCSCLHLLVKKVFVSECVDGYTGPSGSMLGPTVIAFVAFAFLAFAANVVFLFQSRSRRRSALVQGIFSNWQPLFFFIVTLEKLFLWVIVIAIVSGMKFEGDRKCLQSLSLQNDDQIDVPSFIWNFTILLTGLSVLSCDLDANFKLSWRRYAYGNLTLCLLLDAIGSYLWGNMMASRVFFDVGSFTIFLGNQITSCVTSQVLMALHFLYVSSRSRHGRAWAYAPLRFELDESGRASLSKLSMPLMTQTPGKGHEMASATAPFSVSKTACDDLHYPHVAHLSVVSRIRRRWLHFQKRQQARCHVFEIPCAAVNEANTSSDIWVTMARPAFNLRILRPLSKISDSHPKLYVVCGVFFVAIPSFVCSFLEIPDRGSLSLILFIAIIILFRDCLHFCQANAIT